MQHLIAQVQGNGQIALADRVWRVVGIDMAAARHQEHITGLQLHGLPSGRQALGTMQHQSENGTLHPHGFDRVRQLGLDMQAFTGERTVSQCLQLSHQGGGCGRAIHDGLTAPFLHRSCAVHTHSAPRARNG
ncbi:hypothetical protein D3C72_1728160 [compost metagenome]